MAAATLIALAVSAITDARRRVLPVALYPLLLVTAAILDLGVFSANPQQYILTGVIFGLLFLAQALFFEGGGGDVILMLVMGLIYGLVPMLIMVFASAFASVIWYALAAILRGKVIHGRMTFPYAPFLAVGFVVYLLIFMNMGGIS